MVADLFKPQEVTLINGDSKVAEELTKLPFDHIFFTGSTRVGKRVMSAAAQNLTSVTLELGGQNPAIVDETARLQDAAQRLLFGKMLNAGQACVSPNFIFIHKTIEEEFIALIKDELEKCFPGDKKKNPDFARIINKTNHTRVKNLIEDAVAKGAELVTKPDFDEKENFITPTIIKNVPLNAQLFDKEIFGPLIALSSYDNLLPILEFLRLKPVPLAFYIFSQSKKNINFILNNSCSGTVAVNDTTLQFGHPELPFGGHSQSGLGKSHGYYSFVEFSNRRSVLKQRNGLTLSRFVQPPYTGKVKKLVELTLKYF
jgi:aldehyde dehydrogenase (NAD+)